MTQNELFNQLNEQMSLSEIQEYIRQVIAQRGFQDETIQESMLLLLEETGELAKAIRKEAAGMSIDKARMQNYDTMESEIADVFIVLLAICNTLKISLFEALVGKEKANIERVWSMDGEVT